MNKNNENDKTLLGFIVGAAAGVAVGMLLAPFTGEESRKKITDKAKTLNDQLGETINKVTEAGKTVLNKKTKAKSDVTGTASPTSFSTPDTGEKKKSKKVKKNKDNSGPSQG
jgi:gas vesicle protein